MGFLGRLRDVISGKIARGNALVGNHGVRIADKLKTDSSWIGFTLWTTNYCTTYFLTELLFSETPTENFKYSDGTEEHNPFKKRIDLLDEEGSYEMFKLLAGYFFAGLLAVGLRPDDETRIYIPELKNRFFAIYEYNDKDKEIFCELLKLTQDASASHPECRLYEYIFERAYKIDPPPYAYQMSYFMLSVKYTFNKSLVPALVEGWKTDNQR